MYSMKGVLNYQFKTAFIRALQTTYRGERIIAGFYWGLAGQEQETNRRILILWLARLADHKKAYCALLLHQLGAAVPDDLRLAGYKHLYPFDAQKGNHYVMRKLEQLERPKFGKLITICNLQRWWV